MKVIISQPMNGREYEDIKKERDEIAKKFEKMHIEVIDTLFKEDPDESEGYTQPGLFYLAETVDSMGKADAIYFVDRMESS